MPNKSRFDLLVWFRAVCIAGPLGITAKVANLQTGQSAKVTIGDCVPVCERSDRGLSPSTAHKIGIAKHSGVAKVKVDPISVPPSNGSAKPSRRARKAQTNKSASGVHGE